jgi:hypothetical protein
MVAEQYAMGDSLMGPHALITSEHSPAESDDLFFDALIRGYVNGNPRFLRRDWLAGQLLDKLNEKNCRFVLLTAEPGAGKSTFMAQLANDNPAWLRYFIRRDQREVLADVSDRSLLLRIGYQLAALRADLFSQEQLTISVVQRISDVGEHGEAVGVEVNRLAASPFYQKILQIEQQVRANQGRVVGLRVKELIFEPRLLSVSDLVHLALIDPARTLQRSDPEEQIVILIDGLDEIGYHKMPENILALLTNCPALPANVRFVLTSRPPDESLRIFCDKQTSWLSEITLDEQSPNIQADVNQFIRRLAAEPAFTQALQLAEGGAEAFALKASRRAHGNLGYVDALARGIDHALARKDSEALRVLLNLRELPAALRGLYGFFLHQIKTAVARDHIEIRDPETSQLYDKLIWPAIYDRILGVLAVAMEPLELSMIESLGGILAERAWVLPAVERLLPFLETKASRYRLYHTTLAEFLTDDETRADPKTHDLYQDAQQRHHQVVKHYWQYHDNWGKCDAYGLNHLAAHASQAAQFDLLEELINQEWMHVRVARDSHQYSGFVADVELAWGSARENSYRQIDADDSDFDAVAACFHYALIRTTINSLSSIHPPALVKRALETGLWSGSRALDMAALLPNPVARFKTYTAVLDAGDEILTEAQRDEAIRARLSSARAIEDKWARARAMAACGDAEPMLDSIREKVERIIKHTPMDYIELERLVPYLDAEQLDLVLAAALQIDDARDRCDVLAALTRHATIETLGRLKRQVGSWAMIKRFSEALAAALALKNDHDRFGKLIGLAPLLNVEQMREVMTTMLAVQDVWSVSSFLERCDASLLAETLNTALSLEDEFFRAMVIATIASRLTEAQLSDALMAARSITDAFCRATALGAVAPHLSGSAKSKALSNALTAALAVPSEADRTQLLIELIPQLDNDQLNEMLRAVPQYTFTVPWCRAETLTSIGQRFSGEARSLTFGYALAAAREIEDEARRSNTLAALAPHLGGEQLDELLVAAGAISNEHTLAKLLAELAPWLNEDQIRQALVLGQSLSARTRPSHESNFDAPRDIALTALAPRLVGEQLSQALTPARAIGASHRAVVLATLASRLNGEEKTPILTKALVEVRTIRAAWHRAHLFGVVAKYFDGEAKTAVYDEALTSALAIPEAAARAKQLALLAPNLNRPQICRTLNATTGLDDESARATLICGLAPHLGGEQLSEALVAIYSIRHPVYRTQAIVGLAQQMHGLAKALLVSRALARAWILNDNADRARALVALAPHLGRLAGKLALRGAMAAIRSVESERDRADTLGAVAPQLDGSQLSQALAVVRGLEMEWEVAGTLEALGSKLSVEQLGQALAAAREIKEDVFRARALAALGPLLDHEQLSEALAAARAVRDEGNRSEALKTLAPHLRGEQLNEALGAAREIERELYRAGALEALVPNLDSEQLDEALAISRKERQRTQALIAIIPYLSREQLSGALYAAREVKDKRLRLETLLALPFGAEDKLGLREVRRCLVDGIEAQFVHGDYETLLDSINISLGAPFPIFGGRAAAALARHISDDQRWQWL